MKVDVENGSVTLDRNEVQLLARVLDLGLELGAQLGAFEPGANDGNVEVKLIYAIHTLGISADELNDVVDSRFRNV